MYGSIHHYLLNVTRHGSYGGTGAGSAADPHHSTANAPFVFTLFVHRVFTLFVRPEKGRCGSRSLFIDSTRYPSFASHSRAIVAPLAPNSAPPETLCSTRTSAGFQFCCSAWSPFLLLRQTPSPWAVHTRCKTMVLRR